MARIPLGQVLKQGGWLDEEAIEAALDLQTRWRCRFGDALLRLELIHPDELLRVLAQHLGVRAIHIGDRAISPRALERLPQALIVSRRVLPIAFADRPSARRLSVALTAPNDLRLLDDLAFAAGMAIEPLIAAAEDLDQAIERHQAIMRIDAIAVQAA